MFLPGDEYFVGLQVYKKKDIMKFMNFLNVFSKKKQSINLTKKYLSSFFFNMVQFFFQELIEINTRYQDLSNTVEQRLKWACGANPDLQEVFDKFSSSFSAEMEAMRTLIGISKTLSASANTIMQ